jgi:L-threonylcarbamoyladenylate synthase
MNKNIEKAALTLKKGGIIIFPTDTAFGIGCRVDAERSVERLFKIRKRPKEKSVPLLVSSVNMAKNYSKLSADVLKIAEKYWPGGLTLVVPAKTGRIPSLARGGGSSVGLRMPNHSTIIKIIRKVGVPIIGCSANFAGENTPYKVSDLNPELKKLVDLTLYGRTSLRQASTVLDTTRKPYKILRIGAVEIKIVN